MHSKLNWIFIDGIYFKRIENSLHNGKTRCQFDTYECHITIRYHKGEWTPRSCCCGSFSFFLQKKCEIIFELLFVFWLKRMRWKKVELDVTTKSSSERIKLPLFLFLLTAHTVKSFANISGYVRDIAKKKNVWWHNLTDHIEFGCENRYFEAKYIFRNLIYGAHSIKCTQFFTCYTVECRRATSGWLNEQNPNTLYSFFLSLYFFIHKNEFYLFSVLCLFDSSVCDF